MKKLTTLALIVMMTVLSGCVVAPLGGGYGRDRDHDGRPDRVDRDRDGDGVRNRDDRRPDDPRRN